jgi:hypothetical protein
MLASDKDGDRLLNKQEVTGLVLPHFALMSTGWTAGPKELMAVADWLNHHHQPGTPAAR